VLCYSLWHSLGGFMKWILGFSLLAISSVSFAYDVACDAAADNNKVGYYAKQNTLGLSKGTLTFNATANSVICKMNSDNTSGSWQGRTFYAPFPLSGVAEVSGTVTLSNATFKMLDENDKTLGSVTTSDVISQAAGFSIPTSQFLTASELSDLAAGKTVTRNFSFVWESIATATLSNGTTEPLGMWASSFYSLSFTLTGTGDNMTISSSVFQSGGPEDIGPHS
jgi:hypothetical protein